MKKYQKEDLVSYALGITVVYELLMTRPEIVNKIYINSKWHENDTYEEIVNLCKDNNITTEINDKVFNVLSSKENCYVIGEFKKYDSHLYDGIHIVLVNPSNQGNLGTILRSVLGFGIKNIGIIKPSVDIFDPSVVRASMGAVFSIDFEYFNSFEEYQEEYPGKKIYPFMLQAKKKISDVSFDDSCTLVFGPEASGLNETYLEIGTPLIIPITNNIDSLNLPIAVSIACYEATKNSFDFIE